MGVSWKVPDSNNLYLNLSISRLLLENQGIPKIFGADKKGSFENKNFFLSTPV